MSVGKKVSLLQQRKTIKQEIRYVDRKPYSHNIISLTLQCVVRDHGTESANQLIEELHLDELGWCKV